PSVPRLVFAALNTFGFVPPSQERNDPGNESPLPQGYRPTSLTDQTGRPTAGRWLPGGGSEGQRNDPVAPQATVEWSSGLGGRQGKGEEWAPTSSRLPGLTTARPFPAQFKGFPRPPRLPGVLPTILPKGRVAKDFHRPNRFCLSCGRRGISVKPSS